MCDLQKFKNIVNEFQILIYYIKSSELYYDDKFMNATINGFELDLKILNTLIQNENMIAYLLNDEKYINLLQKIFKFLKKYLEENNIDISSFEK